MFADFDLSNLKPILLIGFIVLTVIAQMLGKGRKLLRETWTEETWQPRSPGDSGPAAPPTVIGRYPRTPAPMTPPPLPPAQTPRPAGAWEAELERILRGENARPTVPSPPPAPAPPTPAYRPRQVTFDYNQDSDIESAPAPSAPLATMSESAANQQRADAAYAEGASLHEQVVERMHQIDARVSRHTATVSGTGVARGQASSESAAVRQWLRQHDTARAAIVAAMVFGPPKALEA